MSTYGSVRIGRRSILAAAGASAFVALTSQTTHAAAPSLLPRRAGRRARPRLPVPGFLLDRGRYTTVEAPNAATTTFAFGINNRGQIVGGYDDAMGRAHGFVRDHRGRFTTYDVPGAFATVVSRINDRGRIVGDYFETPEAFEQGRKRGFTFDGRTLTRIDFPGALSTEVAGIDNYGRVVGEAYDTTTGRGYVWERGRFRSINGPGDTPAGALDINERGQICGAYSDALEASTHGFLLYKRRYTTIDAFGAAFTQVFGLDSRGRVVGYTAAGFDLTDPIVLLDARGFLRDTTGRLTRIDVPGAPRTLALGMNDHGQVVGTYESPHTEGSPAASDGNAGGGRTAGTPGSPTPGRPTLGRLALLSGRRFGRHVTG